eukprot:5459230-Amphidinium_carterae.1
MVHFLSTYWAVFGQVLLGWNGRSRAKEAIDGHFGVAGELATTITSRGTVLTVCLSLHRHKTIGLALGVPSEHKPACQNNRMCFQSDQRELAQEVDAKFRTQHTSNFVGLVEQKQVHPRKIKTTIEQRRLKEQTTSQRGHEVFQLASKSVWTCLNKKDDGEWPLDEAPSCTECKHPGNEECLQSKTSPIPCVDPIFTSLQRASVRVPLFVPLVVCCYCHFFGYDCKQVLQPYLDATCSGYK